MNKKIISLIKLPDFIFSKLYLKIFNEKNSLIIFNFHGFFREKEGKTMNIVDPQTWLTLNKFRKFIQYFLINNFNFISPDDILNGLINDKKYIMITFDDGYYNNKYALEYLKKYHIPSVLFPSIEHIIQNKCFWWDVIYRERIKSGESVRNIKYEQNKLKLKGNEEIEEYIIKNFGEKSFEPRGDIDRPFTVSELRDISNEPYIFLGNHTKSHTILTNLSSNKIKSQILDAQNSIYSITGINPLIISYPNGNYSNDIIKISKEIGIKIGVTTDLKKNKLPLDCKEKRCMHLGRFDLSNCDNIIKECELLRSNILLYPRIFNLFNKKC